MYYHLKRVRLGEQSQVFRTPIALTPIPTTPIPTTPIHPANLEIVYITDNNKITIPQSLFDSVFSSCNIEQLTVNYTDYFINCNNIMNKYKDKNIFLLNLTSTGIKNIIIPFLNSNNSYIKNKLFFCLDSTSPELRNDIKINYPHLPIYFILESDDFFIYNTFGLTEHLKTCLILPFDINTNSVYFANLLSLMNDLSVYTINDKQVLNNSILNNYSNIYIIHDDIKIVKNIISELSSSYFNGSIFLVDFSPVTNIVLDDIVNVINDNINDFTLLSPGTNFTINPEHIWVQSLKLNKMKSLPSNTLCIYSLIVTLSTLLSNKLPSSYNSIIDSSMLFNKNIYENSNKLTCPFLLPNFKNVALYIIDEKYIDLHEVSTLINLREKQYYVITYTINNETRNYNIIKKMVNDLNTFEKIVSICIIGNINEVPSFMRVKTINNETLFYPSDISYGIIDNVISIPVGRISSGNINNIEIQKTNIIKTINKIVKNEEYIINLSLPNDPIHKWLTYIIGIASDDKNGNISDDLYIKNELEKFTNQKYENYINNIKYIELYDGSLFNSQQNIDDNGNILDNLGDPTKDELVYNINNYGCGLIEYLGHGLTDKFETTNFTIENVKELTNVDKYFLLIAVACSIGDFSDFETICLADKLQMSENGSYCVFASVIPQTFDPPKSILTFTNDLIRNTNINLTVGDIFLKGINSPEFLWSGLQGNGLNTSDECLYYSLFGDPLSGYTPSYLRINKKSITSIMYRGKKSFKKIVKQTKQAKTTIVTEIKNISTNVNIPSIEKINEWTNKINNVKNTYKNIINKIENIPSFEIDFGKISVIVKEFELNIFFNTNVPYNEIVEILIQFYKFNIDNFSTIDFTNIQNINPLQFIITYLKDLYKMTINETLTLLGSIAVFIAYRGIKFDLGINKLICNFEMEIKDLTFSINNKNYFLINPNSPFNTGDLLYFNDILNEDTYVEITVETKIKIPFNIYASFWTIPEELINTTDMNKMILDKFISYLNENVNKKEMNTLVEINNIIFSVAGLSNQITLSMLDYLDINLEPTVRMCFFAPPPNTYQWGSNISVGLDVIQFITGYMLFLISLLDILNINELNNLLSIINKIKEDMLPVKGVYQTIYNQIEILVNSLTQLIVNINKFSTIASNFLKQDTIKNEIEKVIPFIEFINKININGKFYAPLLI